MQELQQLLAANLRRFRLQAGMSQEQVAERMNVDRAYVSGLERGVRNPTLMTIWLAAQALGVTAAELLADGGPDIPTAEARKRAPRRKPIG